MTPREDTPRAAFALLSRQVTFVVVAVLAVLSLIAWYGTIDQARSMRSMAMGLGQIGIRNQGTMSAALFLGMWATMMAAMMLPTVAPMVLAHLAVTRRRRDGPWPTVVFVAGYLLVWSAIGMLPLLAYWGFAQWEPDTARAWWLHALAGAILALTGAYQFTRWKKVCLDHCQSPFGFIVAHDFGGGSRSALRAGVVHGAYCLGCCWALMAVLLVVGLMNLLWMAIIFVLFLIEKHWRHGEAVAKGAGAVLVLLGIAVMAWPAALELISQ